MRWWADLLIDGLLWKIGCKSCLSLIYVGGASDLLTDGLA